MDKVYTMTTCGYTMPSRSELHREFAGEISVADYCTYSPNVNRINQYTSVERKNRNKYYKMIATMGGIWC
ncbi:hypothetical protein K413DRAFT_4723 [Clostridium sp. ASBs410]|nr:hypothetical protein K413DRAFT_4723 [Clostridium sp. ASBs410]